MKKITSVLLLVLAIITVACIHTVSRCRVTSTDRSMIPYQTGDTVYFLDARGNRVMLTVTDETSEWDHYDEYLWEEYRSVHLKSEDSSYKLNLSLQGWYYGNPYRPLSMGFHYKHDWQGLGDFLYNRSGIFVKRDYSASSGYTKLNLYDSLQFSNHIYYNVAFSEFSQSNESWTCYYNKTHGVLQMTLNEKTVFTLDTVIFAGKR